MKKSNWIKGIMVLMITALVGFGVNVFAADAANPNTMTEKMGTHGKGNHEKCPMMGQMDGKCPRMGDMDGKRKLHQNLTPEETEKFKAERTAFKESTKDLKRDIHQKQLALAAEMAKKSPDQKTAKGIQKELSELKAEMDSKRLEHRFKLKAINPDLGNGMGEFHHKKMMGGKGHSQKRTNRM